MGTMGVALTEASAENAPELNSIPPTLGGGNIDIRLLVPGSAFYLPVKVEGALFHVGDPHFAMAEGEVASVAFRYPFAKDNDVGCRSGCPTRTAQRTGSRTTSTSRCAAVVNALDLLEQDQGMDRTVA
jgi:hypothetical protein